MNQLDMKGRHGVVTGGATGLGFAIAERMVASGARVTAPRLRACPLM
jgi:3-oxoacyl-[acyl-carrier protein] reductase